MNIEGLNISDIVANFKLNTAASLHTDASKASRSFAAVFRNSLKENSLKTGNPSEMEALPPSEAAMDKIGQLASEAEDKYCSMCGSRIKEDGTCPICIVPVFISGNPSSHNQGSSQVDGAHSMTGGRVTLSYNRRKG